jgi:hypothetical protein
MDDLVHSGAVQLFSQTLDRFWPRRPHESRWSTRPRLAAGPIVTMSGAIANAPVGCAGGTREPEPREAVLHGVNHGGEVDADGRQAFSMRLPTPFAKRVDKEDRLLATRGSSRCDRYGVKSLLCHRLDVESGGDQVGQAGDDSFLHSRVRGQ